MKICTSSILGTLPLLAAASGLGLAGTAVAQDGAALDIAATTGNAKPTYHSDITGYQGGGVAGPIVCSFDNGPPADCLRTLRGSGSWSDDRRCG